MNEIISPFVLPMVPYIGELSEWDHMRIVFGIAAKSDCPTVISALETLILATKVAHASEIDQGLRFEAWVGKMSLTMKQRLTSDDGIKAVEIALNSSRPGDVAALANLIEVVHSPTS